MTAVKWAIFVVGLLAAYPVGHWLRDRPALRLQVWTLIGFLPFLSSLDMALVSFGARPGDTNGIEVALIDWLALSMFFAARAPARPMPYRFALTAYLLVALISVTQAQWTLGAFGYVWKLGRMYLLYAAICRAGHERRVPAAILRGLMLGLVYEGLWAVWQHVGLGLYRATGTFAHQNTLGILVNLVVMVPIALVLAGRTTRPTRLALVAAVLTCFFTVSRGALLFLGAGGGLLYLLSALKSFSSRKVRIGLVGLPLVLVLTPLALTTINSRSTVEQARSMQLRDQYERAASMMLEEHPLGIGPNQFTVALLTGGYGARAGVDWSQRIALVHNVYWLTAAEMGYAGLLALVILFLSPLASAVRYGFQARRDRRCDVLLGLAVGLIALYAHSFFEWVWRDTEVSYVYWMAVAVVAILARQVKDGAPASVAASRESTPLARRDLNPAGAMTFAKS